MIASMRSAVAASRDSSWPNDGSLRLLSYCELNRLDRDSAYRELQDLITRQLVHAIGTGPGVRYRVVRGAVPRPPPERSATPRGVLLRRMEAVGFITNADYREAFGLERYAAKQALSRWVTAGVLILEGERRGARYRPGPAWPPSEVEL